MKKIFLFKKIVFSDGTLIKTKSGKVFPTNCQDWQLLYDSIPSDFKKLHSDGFKIVIFTNQKGIHAGKVDRNEFRKKIEAIVGKLGIPVQAFVSVAGGHYRKPCVGMWNELKLRNDEVEINEKESIFVGDAAGRIKTTVRVNRFNFHLILILQSRPKKDHSYADRFFAANVGVKFQTPEEFFGKSKVDEPWGPPNFDPKNLFSEEITELEPHGEIKL